MRRRDELGYGIIGFGRKYIVGVIGLGHGTGVSLITDVINREIVRRGLGQRVICLDNPTNYLDMDTLILVIDPLPSKIKKNIELYSEIKARYDAERNSECTKKQSIVFILNKFNGGVCLKELEAFLKIDFKYIQEFISPKIMYGAEYNEQDIFKITKFDGIIKMTDDLILGEE